MLVAARDKYKKLVQMGNQRRSSVGTTEAIAKIRDGAIGRPYFAKAWYSNTRKSIGVGKEIPVPATLDWDLWQGPAPRRAYKDNVHPYNWHWFWHWGTGETLNNGTHEIDVCRWALGAEYPKLISASGGRYAFKDDWQFYDTLVTDFEYGDKRISWEGLCCNGVKTYGRDRGSLIVGTEGSMMIDQEDYEIYDLGGKKTGSFSEGKSLSSSDLMGSDGMTDRHFRNFIAGIRTGEKLNSPIEVGGVAVTMLLLSNVAWKLGRPLKLDTTNAHVLNDPEAMKYWGREYEKGWAPKI
jgi:predicted dehydrogenase